MTAGTARCVECGRRGHPAEIIPRSYCEHRTCMRGPCWARHPKACPGIRAATGHPTPAPAPAAAEASPAGFEQPALFEVMTQ